MREAELVLQTWVSPACPVGAFAYSHGLETAVDDGDIRDAASLADWLLALMEHGAARNDAVLAGEAWRAATARNAAALGHINDLALALAPSRERRLEAVSTGNAFAQVVRSAWPDAECTLWPVGDLAYPVAFGAACGTYPIPLGASLCGFMLGFVQNIVSAAVRLGPIGQTDGQRVTAALIPEACRVAERAQTATLDDLGGCAQRSDIASLRHETLYSRLFRS